jgi:hypothetical protein
MNKIMAVVLSLMLATLMFADWKPKAEIKAERTGPTTFKLSGKNCHGDLDVKLEDKNLFQGFKGEGKNGDKNVSMDIKSAGLGGGWDLTGQLGNDKIDVRAKKEGVLSDEWKVTGTVGDRKVDATIKGDWAVDPAIVAALACFDC